MEIANIDNPLVTVGVVTYNSAKYVHEAISSVLHSGYTNLELVICDDCSTDDTWEIIQKFNDPRIRAYRNNKNLREYANRNQVIDLAKGKYFIFIDGDDIIFPCSIERVVKMLNAFPEASYCIAALGRNDMIYPFVFSPELVYKLLYNDISFFSHSFAQAAFKTSVLKELKLSENYIAGDTDLFLRLSTSYSLLVINAPLSWWRETPNQASKKLKGVKGTLEHFNMFRNILTLEKTPLKEDEKQYLISNYSRTLSRLFIKCLLKWQFSCAIQLWPYFKFSSLFSPEKPKSDLVLPSPDSPWTMPKNRNPYSNYYKDGVINYVS